MAEVTKVREALMAELLGDVDQLVQKVETLERDIEHTTDGAAEKIAAHTAKLEDAARQIMGHLQELVKSSGVVASAKMKEARELQEVELQRSVAASIDAAIDKAVSRSVGRLDQALKTLEVAAARSEQKVAAAAEASRPGWSSLIAGVAGFAALIGGVGGFLASRVF
jgi:hypothetical protein